MDEVGDVREGRAEKGRRRRRWRGKRRRRRRWM
jgi:hypothetical protein